MPRSSRSAAKHVTTSDLTLAPLVREDIPTFAKMVVQLYVDDPSSTVMTIERATAQAARMLDAPAQVSPFLLRRGELVLGYVVLVPFFSNEYGGLIGVVDELFVRSEFRGKGFGGQALELAKAVAAARGWVRLTLETNAANARARALYERQGFVSLTRIIMSARLLGGG